MGIRTVIPGPPGTGKTFRLVNHYLEKEINEYINSFGRFGIPVNVIYSSSVPQGILLN